jgi:hypothetical protein
MCVDPTNPAISLISYFHKSRVHPPLRDMNVPTLQLPDDDTTPKISIRRSASVPSFNISDGAQRATREGSTSDTSSQ